MCAAPVRAALRRFCHVGTKVMHSTRTVVLLLAVGLASELFASQQEAGGLLEDSELSLLSRSFYEHAQYESATLAAMEEDEEEGDPRDWAQAALLEFESGFTRGTLGFGLDAFAYGVLKLDGGRGHAGFGNLKSEHDGDLRPAFARVGAALKMRVSETVLHYGEMAPETPVFAAEGDRILPQTATGMLLASNELDDLELVAGHFTAGAEPTTTNHKGGLWASYAGVESGQVDFFGVEYRSGESLGGGFYAAVLEDIWRQYYGNLQYAHPLAAGQSLAFDFHLYRTQEQGAALAGKIDNTAWSLATTYAHDEHSLTLTYQRIDSDTPFDYIGFGDNTDAGQGESIYLANEMQISEFNGPREQSMTLRYALDLAGYDLPGLNAQLSYTHGWGIDGSHADPAGSYAGLYGKERDHSEVDLKLGYTVQAGHARGLSLVLLQAWHIAGQGHPDASGHELRLIAEYPLDLL